MRKRCHSWVVRVFEVVRLSYCRRGKSDTDARATATFCCLCHGNICQQVGKYPKRSDNDSNNKYFQAHIRFHLTFDIAVSGWIP